MLQGSNDHGEVTVLHLGRDLCFCRRMQRYCYCILQEESGPCPEAILLFLDCSSFVFVFLPFPDEQLFESALWNSGEVKEAE